MSSFKNLFAPESVAVIGTSRREGSLGKMFLDAIVRMEYKGIVYPINPKADVINNIPCYPDISSLPVTPELAVILLPKEMVLDTVKELAKKKVRNIVVVSAGFKEVGKEGQQREEALLKLARDNGIRIVGPNSMGLFNTASDVSLNATFSPTPPIPGHVGFVSQSGALGVAVLELSLRMGLGFSCFVSTGNKADVGDVECLRFLSEDPNTKAIILYQEGIDNPTEFRQICSETVSRKPILTLKAGRTESGLKAASSHTGALSSDDTITDAFLEQCGIVRCKTLDELMNSALALVSQPLPAGNRVAVISNAGGPGILASDALEKNDLTLASLSEQTIADLKEILPTEAGFYNPVDMIASATHETYKKVCAVVEKDPNVDSLFIIIVKPPVNTTPKEIINELKPVIEGSQKPFYCTLMARENSDAGLEDFRKLNIPVFSFPESTARVLGNISKYMNAKSRFEKSKLKNYNNSAIDLSRIKNKKQASFRKIMSLLSEYNIRTCEHRLTTEKSDVLEFQKNTGNVVLKIANEEIIHKSDQGLVKLNLSNPSEVENAFDEITKKARPLIPGNTKPLILTQKMMKDGVELVLGANRNPVFGSVIMFGIGGIFVELYKDVVFRVLPIDEIDAEQMINRLRGKKILDGFRHLPAIKKDVLIKTILNFARIISENQEIVEMDLNPLIWPVGGNEPVVVDSRCTLTIDL